MCDCEKLSAEIVADSATWNGADWIDESDKWMLANSDSDFYFSCGCWSGAADHYACTGIGQYKARYGCRCGAPDDCYCHEDCSGLEGCEQHVAEYREMIVEDHAEAILMDIQRDLWV